MFLARWTHEAAREGTVPLCGDDIWNPQTSLASPHSGLMKQPTKEGSVSEIPEGMNGGPRRKDLTQGSLIVSRYRGRLAWHDFALLNSAIPPLVCIVMVHPC